MRRWLMSAVPFFFLCLPGGLGFSCVGGLAVDDDDAAGDDDAIDDDDATDDDDAADDDTGEPAVSDLDARLHESIESIVYVSWTQSRETDEVAVEYGFDVGVVETTPPVAGTVGDHEQIVLGVPFGVELSWRVVTVDDPGGSSEVTETFEGPAIETGALPSGVPEVWLDVAQESAWETSGRFLLTSVSQNPAFQTTTPAFWIVIVDRQGRTVWAEALDPQTVTLFARPARDGAAILFDESTYWTEFNDGLDSMVHRILLDGSVERSWATPGLSHAFEDLSTDTIAWLASSNYHDTLMVRQGNEDAEELWNCEDWAASEGMAYGICGSNSLFWNEATNSYTLSLWSHEGVGEWDADTGEMTWFSAPADHRGYTLAPQSPVWLWQHEVQLLAPDRLLLSSGVDEHWDGTFGATAAYEYAIDHQAETIDLVWSNVSDGDFVADYKGGAYRLAGGNTLHTYGNSGGVREYTTDGVVVWQARFVSPNECWIGRASWLNDLYAFVP